MKHQSALFVDLYELTMARAYVKGEMDGDAVFSLYYRSLPDDWEYAIACGLETVLDYLVKLRFTPEECDWIASREEFDDDFAAWLRDFRFTGEVRAVPEGTPIFPDEPILEIRAPIAQAQVVETFVMNQIHLQTVLASRAARVVQAAGDADVVDFGMRRMHGIDAAMKGARAFYIAGVAATSNVQAGRELGIPITGTMAHAYIQAYDSEMEAFRAFSAIYPETVLLVDSYDTVEGVRKVVALAEELGADFRVRGIRLDSGDLGALAHASRAILDDAGLESVQIIASGGLDEFKIRDLRASGAPIDAYGVGTRMGVPPVLDIAYKLTSYAGKGRLKLSSGKRILPGAKQIFRTDEGDILAGADESHPGRPLLEGVMEGGRRTGARRSLDELRDRCADEVGRIALPWEVRISDALRARQDRVADSVAP